MEENIHTRLVPALLSHGNLIQYFRRLSYFATFSLTKLPKGS